MKISITTFRRLATASAICFGLLVLTGGAVRLTGSGLGCPDWPSCYAHRATAAASFHPLVEFSNRLVSVAVTVAVIATFLAALRLEQRRRDLVWLATALVGGILAQIVIGGLVVLFSLNPYLVALHFLATLAVLAVALVLRHRSVVNRCSRRRTVGPELVWLSRLLLGTLGILVTVGTVVSGSGPHAGAPNAKRIDIAFRDIAELHSTIALFLIGLTLATLFALHQARAPREVQRLAQIFLEVLAIQGVLGYTQYFLHDAAVVVEFHLLGATCAWVAAILYYLSLHEEDSNTASLPNHEQFAAFASPSGVTNGA